MRGSKRKSCMGRVGFEPTRGLKASGDFKSPASADSATGPYFRRRQLTIRNITTIVLESQRKIKFVIRKAK